jgi:hypothetical protein
LQEQKTKPSQASKNTTQKQIRSLIKISQTSSKKREESPRPRKEEEFGEGRKEARPEKEGAWSLSKTTSCRNKRSRLVGAQKMDILRRRVGKFLRIKRGEFLRLYDYEIVNF